MYWFRQVCSRMVVNLSSCHVSFTLFVFVALNKLGKSFIWMFSIQVIIAETSSHGSTII
jgi:hypothetical protein